VTTSPLRRSALLFVLLALAAALLVQLGERDRLSSGLENLTIWFLAPGFLLRGLASRSELGFHDWRDLALTAVGTAATYAAIFALIDRVYRRRR
jgi:predicted permease